MFLKVTDNINVMVSDAGISITDTQDDHKIIIEKPADATRLVRVLMAARDVLEVAQDD